MSVVSKDLSANCPACGQKNVPGLNFCIYCGQPLKASAFDDREEGETVCPHCNRADSLNAHFCIFCAADIRTPPSEAVINEKAALAGKAAGKKAGAVPAFIFAAASIAGIVCGAAIFFLTEAFGLNMLILQRFWPQQGLLIYSSPPSCQVVIEEIGGKTFTVGETSLDGTLAVSSLKPGAYRLFLRAPGKPDAVREVDVAGAPVTVLGFPERIKL